MILLTTKGMIIVRKIKLGEVVSIKMGINLSRQSEEDKAKMEIYTNNDLINDLNGVEQTSNKDFRKKDISNHKVFEGDVVYSFINSISGIVSKHNSGKIINQNFASIEPLNEMLDSSYLCYLLNMDREINQEKKISMQGSALKRLSPASIKNFEVELPVIEKQRIIGRLYLDWMARQAIIKEQYELENSIFGDYLNKLKNDQL